MNIKDLVRSGILTLTGLAWIVPVVVGFQQPQKTTAQTKQTQKKTQTKKATSKNLPPKLSPKQQLLKKARAAYYSLKTEGMKGFSCTMVPNWAALLEEPRKADPAKIDEAIERLKGIHFSVDVDADGGAKVAHNEISADNDAMAKGLAQVYSGMEQMTSGFFQTWAVFVIHPALPEQGTDFDLETSPLQYHLAYKEGGTKAPAEAEKPAGTEVMPAVAPESATAIDVTMSRLFVIDSVKVAADKFTSTIKPQFAKTRKGYLLIGYDAEYQGSTGSDRTELHVNLENQSVSGLQVPKKLMLKGLYNGSPFAVEVVFSGCTATP